MIDRKITQEDLRNAKAAGVWTLEKDSAFYLKRSPVTWDLRAPMMVLKSGTVVHVERVYRRGRAALLCYIDSTGKIWWSWTHASVKESK